MPGRWSDACATVLKQPFECIGSKATVLMPLNDAIMLTAAGELKQSARTRAIRTNRNFSAWYVMQNEKRRFGEASPFVLLRYAGEDLHTHTHRVCWPCVRSAVCVCPLHRPLSAASACAHIYTMIEFSVWRKVWRKSSHRTSPTLTLLPFGGCVCVCVSK